MGEPPRPRANKSIFQLTETSNQLHTHTKKYYSAHALTYSQSHHLDSRDVAEAKAPFAAARDKKIIGTRAEGVEGAVSEAERLDTSFERRTCLCLCKLSWEAAQTATPSAL